jgi:hypothetical protein
MKVRIVQVLMTFGTTSYGLYFLCLGSKFFFQHRIVTAALAKLLLDVFCLSARLPCIVQQRQIELFG